MERDPKYGDIRYAWSRQHDARDMPTFTVVLLIRSELEKVVEGHAQNGLLGLILRCWSQALEIPLQDATSCLSVDPEITRPKAYLTLNDEESFASFFYYSSAMCTTAGKPFGRGFHVFGSSRRPDPDAWCH